MICGNCTLLSRRSCSGRSLQFFDFIVDEEDGLAQILDGLGVVGHAFLMLQTMTPQILHGRADVEVIVPNDGDALDT